MIVSNIMSSSTLARRQQERLMDRIKALRKLKENRKCFECHSKVSYPLFMCSCTHFALCLCLCTCVQRLVITTHTHSIPYMYRCHVIFSQFIVIHGNLYVYGSELCFCVIRAHHVWIQPITHLCVWPAVEFCRFNTIDHIKGHLHRHLHRHADECSTFVSSLFPFQAFPIPKLRLLKMAGTKLPRRSIWASSLEMIRCQPLVTLRTLRNLYVRSHNASLCVLFASGLIQIFD